MQFQTLREDFGFFGRV
ncbi:hypothetical protein D039_4388A, partial [Vibrio parahaemolyticus EKP-028]